MTRMRNLDDLLREWVDDGAERLPQHHLDAALAEIVNTPQHGARSAPAEGFLMRIQQLAVPMGVVAALVFAFIALALVTGQEDVGPPPSTSASASIRPTASLGTPAAASEAIIEEAVRSDGIRLIGSMAPSSAWVGTSRDSSIGSGVGSTDLTGYLFTPNSLQSWFTLYLDPDGSYESPSLTDGERLSASIGWNLGGGGDETGSVISRDGECSVTFSTFTSTAIEGGIECTDVPGSWTDPELGRQEGTLDFRASFSFDPVADAYEMPVSGSN